MDIGEVVCKNRGVMIIGKNDKLFFGDYIIIINDP
jgi:hypothetical protein